MKHLSTFGNDLSFFPRWKLLLTTGGSHKSYSNNILLFQIILKCTHFTTEPSKPKKSEAVCLHADRRGRSVETKSPGKFSPWLSTKPAVGHLLRGKGEKRRDRWEFAIILTKTFHTIHCESTLRVTRRQLRSHKGGWLLYQAGKRSNVCLAVPHGGHSALSIGRLMHSKYHKSFNGGHSRPFTVDFKDSWDENIRLVWILWP